MLKSLSTSLVLRGLLALGIGVVALVWPGVTVLALVVLFAVYAFIAAGLQGTRTSTQLVPVRCLLLRPPFCRI